MKRNVLVLAVALLLLAGAGVALAAAGDDNAAGMARVAKGKRSVVVSPGFDVTEDTKIVATLASYTRDGLVVERVARNFRDDTFKIFLTGRAPWKLNVSWIALNGDDLGGSVTNGDGAVSGPMVLTDMADDLRQFDGHAELAESVSVEVPGFLRTGMTCLSPLQMIIDYENLLGQDVDQLIIQPDRVEYRVLQAFTRGSSDAGSGVHIVQERVFEHPDFGSAHVFYRGAQSPNVDGEIVCDASVTAVVQSN